MTVDEALTVADSWEKRRDYDEASVKHQVVLALKLEVRSLREVIVTIEEDVRVAAGELMVEMPEPGSPMARVMVANALMRRERNEADAEVKRLREQLDAACSAVDATLVKAVLGVEVEGVNAKLARVEARVAKWKHSPRVRSDLGFCAAEIELDLRGTP